MIFLSNFNKQTDNFENKSKRSKYSVKKKKNPRLKKKIANLAR
jgi:hypothetical protein